MCYSGSIGMGETELWRRMDIVMTLGCCLMILPMQNHLGKMPLCRKYSGLFLGSFWCLTGPKKIDKGSLGKGKIDFGHRYKQQDCNHPEQCWVGTILSGIWASMRAKGPQMCISRFFWDRLMRRDVFMYEFRLPQHDFILLEPYSENVAE